MPETADVRQCSPEETVAMVRHALSGARSRGNAGPYSGISESQQKSDSDKWLLDLIKTMPHRASLSPALAQNLVNGRFFDAVNQAEAQVLLVNGS